MNSKPGMRSDWINDMVEYLGLWVLIALAINMWALISVVGAKVSLTRKALWALILLVPAVGFVAWFILGPRGKAA